MGEILKDKSYKDYSYISRYTNVPYYFNSIDQKFMYGTTYPMSKDVTYLIHKVVRNETPDSISLTYYNTPLYYWVILDYNDIQDPFIELEIGQELKIPTLSAINFEVNK